MKRISGRGRVLSDPLDVIEAFERDVVLRRSQALGGPSEGGGARGRITALSPASRRRLVLAARNVEDLDLHGVWTYPADFPMDGARVKGQWRAMRKRLTRRGYRGLWWLEFQRRGAPHFHAAMRNGTGLDAGALAGEREWVARAWYEVVGSGDPKHLRAGTYLDEWRSGAYGLQDYVAKEAAKWVQKAVPEGYEDVGRFWALFGGATVERVRVVGPRAELAVVARVARGAERADRRAQGLNERQDKGKVGFTAYGAGGAVRRWLAEGDRA